MDLVQLLTIIIVLPTIYYCVGDFRQVFLVKMLSDKPFQHFTFLVVIGLFFLWSAKAGIKSGLDIHFLALTCITLIYGWRVAFLLTLPVSIALIITGQLELNNLIPFLFVSSLLPILLSQAVFFVSYQVLPRNIFIYIFIAGFLNGGLTGSCHLLINAFYQLWIGQHEWIEIKNNYLIFIPLLIFPEGLLNGMATAILSVYKPEWLRTFSDKDYIYNHLQK